MQKLRKKGKLNEIDKAIMAIILIYVLNEMDEVFEKHCKE
jgi:hypothetical protein